jgi:hypothetical protein
MGAINWTEGSIVEERVAYTVKHRTISPYKDMRLPDGSLAFRYDPARRIVEIQLRGKKHYFDLAQMELEPIDNNA